MNTLHCVCKSIYNDDVTISQWHVILWIHQTMCCISISWFFSWTNTIKAFMIIIQTLNRYQRNVGMITQYCVSNVIYNYDVSTSRWHAMLNVKEKMCYQINVGIIIYNRLCFHSSNRCNNIDITNHMHT